MASIGAQKNDLRSYPRVIDGKNSDQSEYRTSGPMKMVLSNEPMKMTGIIEPMKMNIGKNRKKEKSILRSVPIKTASKAKNGIKGNHKEYFLFPIFTHLRVIYGKKKIFVSTRNFQWWIFYDFL